MRSSLSIGVCVCSLALLLMGQEGGCGGTADGGDPGGAKNDCGRVGGEEAETVCSRWCETDECGAKPSQTFDLCMYNCRPSLARCCSLTRAANLTCVVENDCLSCGILPTVESQPNPEYCSHSVSVSGDDPLEDFCLACIEEIPGCADNPMLAGARTLPRRLSWLLEHP